MHTTKAHYHRNYKNTQIRTVPNVQRLDGLQKDFEILQVVQNFDEEAFVHQCFAGQVCRCCKT